VSTKISDNTITVSSGNGFRDLGRPEPELLLFKAQLADQVRVANRPLRLDTNASSRPSGS